MPVTLPDNLPAIEQLKSENIFVMTQLRALSQDIRPLKILVLNLMPLKIDTETDLVRLLSNNPLQIDLALVKLSSHQSIHTSEQHMQMFYKNFSEVEDAYFDGMIVTGAPVEKIDYSQVDYWDEITHIFHWARTHVTSTFYICWAAQAALYHFYGVPKYPLPEKLFGVYRHTICNSATPLFRGFDDEFFVPHSRHTEVRAEDLTHPDLQILSVSAQAGLYIAAGRGGRELYVTGHSEYSLHTLDREYRRDLAKGLPIKPPENYYKHNNPLEPCISRWRGHGNLLFNNWINYYVYQETMFDPSLIPTLENINPLKNEPAA